MRGARDRCGRVSISHTTADTSVRSIWLEVALRDKDFHRLVLNQAVWSASFWRQQSCNGIIAPSPLSLEPMFMPTSALIHASGL